jgi:ABC-2 type transport system ATP-binding protein
MIQCRGTFRLRTEARGGGRATAPNQEPGVAAVEVDGVSKRFRHRRLGWRGWEEETVSAVDRVFLTVKPGEIYGLLGLNGSGKSTLIRMMATLLLPDSGQIRIFGHDVVQERDQVRQWLARVSAEAGFFKKLTARENLRYAAGLYGVNPRASNSKKWRSPEP